MEQRKGPRPPIQMGMGIGIDLGSAYTRIAVFNGCHYGCSAVPSYVAFTDLGVLVGEAAKKQATENPTNTIFDVIRLIGRRYSDPSVQKDMKLWPFEVTDGPDDRLLINVCWKNKLWHFTPVEICSMILMQMKENAEMKLGATIIDAVITVPVHFNYEQRQEIRQAGMISGLNFLQIISAPAASALFYGTQRLSKSSRTFSEVIQSLLRSEPKNHNMIIIDVGAGTVDVSLVTVKEDMCKVRAAVGNIHLGGLDFDNTMVDYFVDLIKRTKHTDISNNPRTLTELRALCEQAKIALSFYPDRVPMTISIGPLDNSVNFKVSISAAKFNELNKALFLKCVDMIETCIRDVKIGVDMVHEVILAGGSVRIPLLQSYIQRFFEGKELKLSEHLETATAYGAAFQAFICSLKENRRVNALSLLDVTPFSFGIRTSQNTMTVCIPKHTTIPTKNVCMFTLGIPYNKKEYLVEVYEGERTVITENILLGKFEISGTDFSPNESEVNICFEIHENGTLSVSGVEISSGMRNGITIANNNIEDSYKRVWEALLYQQTENGTNKASTTKGINHKSDRIKDKKTQAKLLSMGQSSRQYIEPEEYAVGIDFGTTYSSVAVWRRNSVRIIENEYGSRLTCSAVAFTDTGRLIGDTVHKEQVTTNPANTIPNVKRLIGKCFSDQSVQNDRKFLPFRILGDDRNRSMVLVQYKNEEKLFAPEEIAAMILSKMKEIAEAYLSSKVTNAVVSVPAFFSDSQRKAIKDAGVIAGLNVMQLLNEPTAAAIAYFSQKVRAKSFSIKRTKHTDISNNPRALSELRALCEQAKIDLSFDADIVPMMTGMGPLCNNVEIELSISTAEFNELNKALVLKCVDIIDTCIRDVKNGADMVHEVILAGGSMRIPLLQSYIQRCFEGKEFNLSEHLETATAYGAAFQAFICSLTENERVQGLSLLDVTPFSLGIKTLPQKMTVFIPKHTPIPTKKEMMFTSKNTKILVEVYEGESGVTTENNLLGKFEISGTSLSPNGCNFNVGFEIHENGTLTVMGVEISGGMRNGITISNKNMEDSRKRVWEALFYHQTQNGINKASTTKGINRKSDRIKDKKMKSPLLSMGQSTNQYIEPEEYAIGIDFGTTNSSIAVWHRNCVRIIENEYGSRLTCSAVAFTDTDRLIGDTVHKEQVTTSPANTIPNVKRLIGKCFSDQSVQNDRKFLPFRILGDDQNRSMVLVQYKNEEKLFAPEEIAAMILSKMKEIAEAYLSSKVTNAVVSVPACFSDSQRKAIKDAGVIAGLNVMQLLNEPTAAAIAYFSQKVSAKSSSEKTLLIFDLGGGNLDVSIVTINKGTIRVRAVVGDTNLGGVDFDNNMVCHFVEKFIKEKKRDISNKQRSLRRLRAACEKAKRVLSTNTQTVVEIDSLDDGIDFRSTITREDFEKLNMSLFKRSIGCIERCFEDAKMNRGCIDEVILVGGSTRIPKIQQLLQEFFNGKELCKSMNADEAVVYGAAVQAAILSSNENCKKFNISKLQDITSQSFGLESKDGAITNVLIPKHTPIPAEKELFFTTCSDNLSNFLIEVQECELASLTVFNISGITPKPRGKSNFCVSLEVDDSGMLNLTAKDISMREKNEKFAISKENGGLTTEEIHKMIEAAACYKAQDEEHKARAAALNSLENFAYKMKAIARDPFSSVPASGKKLVEEAADQVIAWMDTNHHAGIDKINAQKKHLETIQRKVTPIV